MARRKSWHSKRTRREAITLIKPNRRRARELSIEHPSLLPCSNDDVERQPSQPAATVSRPFFDHIDAVDTGNQGSTVVGKLRPLQYKENGFTQGIDNINNTNNNENIIVSLQSLSTLCQAFASHACAQPKFGVHIVKRFGLCPTVKGQCEHCKFETSLIKMYTEIVSSGGKGPAAGAINKSLVLATLKSKVGPSDVHLFLTCMNIKPMSRSYIQRTFSRLSTKMTELNKASMLENQRFVRECLELLGKRPVVAVETDMAYNNRLQAGFEAASASFSPLVEQETKCKLTLAMETGNKLCLKPSCDHSGAHCSRTYGVDQTMSSGERALTLKNLESVRTANIVGVKSLMTDGSSQYPKLVRDYCNTTGLNIQHETCFLHLLRNLYKKLRALKLTSIDHNFDKDVFMEKLASCVRCRIRLELARIRQSCTGDLFISRSQTALRTIMPCLSGLHTNCRANSVVCVAHLPSYNTRHLPYGQHLDLNREDELKVQTVINNSLSLATLKKIPNLQTTNKTESLNHRAFTYAPKSTLWGRNFDGLCHSAVHSDSLGTGQSALILSKSIGLKYHRHDPFWKEMAKRDRIDRYHALRKRTAQYKYIRHLGKLKKCNRKIRTQSLYAQSTPEQATTHNYGVNLTNH